MTIQEVSGNPSWAIPYYLRTEAEAYRMFMGIAHVVGVQYSTDVPIVDGWAHYQEIFNPVVVPENTEGAHGPWKIQLAHAVRFRSPDKAAYRLPFIIEPSIQVSNGEVYEEIIRPTLHVYVEPQTVPQIHLARASRLNRGSMARPLQNQARFVTWLAMAEAQVL